MDGEAPTILSDGSELVIGEITTVHPFTAAYFEQNACTVVTRTDADELMRTP
ncbi:MAG: hypothetical protein WDO24_28985 [Pseudomonadota bacterium]